MIEAGKVCSAGGALGPVVEVLGVKITNITRSQAIAAMDAWIANKPRTTHTISIVNAHTLNLAYEDPGFRLRLNESSAVFGDGSGVRLGARMKGVRMVDNLVGTDLIPEFIAAQLDAGRSYYLLGGAEGVAERAVERLRADFPGICIKGCQHGYLDENTSAGAVARINEAAPDMLLVAMGNPIQETWIHNHAATLCVPVCVGIGGLIDHWAGNLKRAHWWVRKLGLEWLQILLQQPGQKWRRYILGNPRFVARCIADSLFTKKPPLGDEAGGR